LIAGILTSCPAMAGIYHRRSGVPPKAGQAHIVAFWVLIIGIASSNHASIP